MRKTKTLRLQSKACLLRDIPTHQPKPVLATQNAASCPLKGHQNPSRTRCHCICYDAAEAGGTCKNVPPTLIDGNRMPQRLSSLRDKKSVRKSKEERQTTYHYSRFTPRIEVHLHPAQMPHPRDSLQRQPAQCWVLREATNVARKARQHDAAVHRWGPAGHRRCRSPFRGPL
jgi:hypothetical protein